jgi:hypothetical protein
MQEKNHLKRKMINFRQKIINQSHERNSCPYKASRNLIFKLIEGYTLEQLNKVPEGFQQYYLECCSYCGNTTIIGL